MTITLWAVVPCFPNRWHYPHKCSSMASRLQEPLVIVEVKGQYNWSLNGSKKFKVKLFCKFFFFVLFCSEGGKWVLKTICWAHFYSKSTANIIYVVWIYQKTFVSVIKKMNALRSTSKGQTTSCRCTTTYLPTFLLALEEEVEEVKL